MVSVKIFSLCLLATWFAARSAQYWSHERKCNVDSLMRFPAASRLLGDSRLFCKTLVNAVRTSPSARTRSSGIYNA
ncbi:hypothetical protein BC832DRAFT_312597 [Gaertneriomyces semiglobifer]|nr:hypothetical protein BC832DRAFT_312597 [Gaertneriomyces semiglobifer]